jgi:hypothetical protein
MLISEFEYIHTLPVSSALLKRRKKVQASCGNVLKNVSKTKFFRVSIYWKFKQVE